MDYLEYAKNRINRLPWRRERKEEIATRSEVDEDVARALFTGYDKLISIRKEMETYSDDMWFDDEQKQQKLRRYDVVAEDMRRTLSLFMVLVIDGMDWEV